MAVTFSQIKSNMTPYRNPNSVASNVEVVGWRIEGWVVTRNLLFRSTMKGQGQRSDKDKYGRSSYLTLIMFNNVTFTLTKGEIYSLPVNINGETQYAELPNLNTNTIRLKCTCFTGDTLIPLADGYSVPIKDLVGKEEFYVYSFDEKKKKIVIGKASNCEVKEQNAQLVKITFDNGEEIKCTPDHKFLLKTGEWVEAKDLTLEMSLEAVYRRIGSDKMVKDYEQVLQRDSWEFTHRLTDEHIEFEKLAARTRHHIDFNKYNNNPNNIQIMNFNEHRLLHQKRMNGDGNPMRNPVYRAKATATMIANEAITHNISNRMKENNPMFDSKTVEKVVTTMKYNNSISDKNYRKGLDTMHDTTKEKVAKGEHHWQTEEYRELCKVKSKNNKAALGCKHSEESIERHRLAGLNPETQRKANKGRILRIFKDIIFNGLQITKDTYAQFKRRTSPRWDNIEKYDSIENLVNSATNHKILKVEYIEERQDVYCFTVEKYNNFMIDVDNGKGQSSGVIAHNCPDFRFRFEKELYDVGGIIGNWNRYKKVPGSNRGPVNPDHRLGYCKHVYSLLKSLKIMGYVKE